MKRRNADLSSLWSAHAQKMKVLASTSNQQNSENIDNGPVTKIENVVGQETQDTIQRRQMRVFMMLIVFQMILPRGHV